MNIFFDGVTTFLEIEPTSAGHRTGGARRRTIDGFVRELSQKTVDERLQARTPRSHNCFSAAGTG
jgi:hypothetical protein